MGLVLCIANQKGGVGKSTIVFHLAGALADAGKKILVIDLDQQGNLSSAFLQDIYSLSHTALNIFLEEGCSPEELIISTDQENIDLVPANLDFSSVDIQLATEMDAQFLLADWLEPMKNRYDYILMDCPPSLGLATRAALVASNAVIIPIECQEWSSRGSSHLRAALEKVKKRANPRLDILGYLISKFDCRRKLEKGYRQVLCETFGALVFNTAIRNSVRYSEASNAKTPITRYLPRSPHAQTYRELAEEIMKRGARI